MRATFRQIETFLLVHREGSFAAAAKRLNISHVAIGKQIAALERAMGGEVFERRIGERVQLNTRGLLLLEKAPELLDRARQLSNELAGESAAQTTVRVTSGDFILTTIFYPNISEFYRTHTGIQVEFVEGDPALESVSAMAAKKIDLAYFTLPDHSAPTSGELLAKAAGGLFISPHFPEATTWRNESIDPLPIIMPLAGSRLERLIRKSLASGGITNYRVAAHVQPESARRELAMSGLGAIVTTAPQIRAAVSAGRLIEMRHCFEPHQLGRYVFRNPTSTGPHVSIVENYLSSLVRSTVRVGSE